MWHKLSVLEWHCVALVSLFLSFSEATAAFNSDGDVIVQTAADAKEAREACPTIGGNLIIGDISEQINLDGIEWVRGDLVHNNCTTNETYCEDFIKPRLEVSSSTLTAINGSIDFRLFYGLNKLLLPNLEFVDGNVSFSNLAAIADLDLTSLAYVSSFHLDAPTLRRLDLKGLQGFTSPNGGAVNISRCGHIDSLNGFFRNPIETSDKTSVISASIYEPFRVRNVTLGWTNVTDLHVSGDNLTVTLGGPSTKSMDIKQMANINGVRLIRSSNLQSLTVGSVSISQDESEEGTPSVWGSVLFEKGRSMERLSLPFDNVSEIEIRDFNITTLVLPAKAENWDGVTISTRDGYVDFKEYDKNGTKIWYWPETMFNLSLTGSIQNNFFDSFFERKTQVTNAFGDL
ncbi:hypothetical protein AK830_g9059 [Neonectria ditissima]|uniref:Receptor L-domain domain-containing protein n=1 Tax=Neonectria ditissima TaxID=78410 RepID=A0A0P7B6G3_9HYPO|nr:hypothetical protein AK830_g9059 [Neonectria ditissima]